MNELLLVPILVVGYGALAAHWWRRSRTADTASEEKLSQVLTRKEELGGEVAQVLSQCRDLEAQLDEVSVVYHCLKNMGEVLEFAETLESWCQSLHDWAAFEKGILILVEKKGDHQELKNIFEIQFSSTEKKPRFEIQNTKYSKTAQKLLERVGARHAAPLPLSSGEIFSGEGVAFPLTVQGELVGILALQGVAPQKLDTLQFLAAEFSLEIKKKMLYEKVKELSVIDSLSGLYLRRYFIGQLHFELERSRGEGTPTSVLLVDIDHFKQVNDQFGHLVGDRVIQEVARLLAQNSREVDLVGRYGGDEFVVMLPRTGRSDAQRVGQRYLTALKEYEFHLPGLSVHPTMSIGMACAPDDAATVDDLIAAADKNLYAAKLGGRNQFGGHNT